MKVQNFLLAAVLAVTGTNGANAAPLNFYNSVDPDTTLRFSVECSLGCEGALFDGTPTSWSPTKGALMTFPGGDSLSVLNTVTGESFTSETETDRGGVDTATFFSSAKYIAFKIGGGLEDTWAIIRNFAENNEFTFTKEARASGFSNTREYQYGSVAPVPLPAAGWLMLAGIGGLVAMRRRKRTV